MEWIWFLILESLWLLTRDQLPSQATINAGYKWAFLYQKSQGYNFSQGDERLQAADECPGWNRANRLQPSTWQLDQVDQPTSFSESKSNKRSLFKYLKKNPSLTIILPSPIDYRPPDSGTNLSNISWTTQSQWIKDKPNNQNEIQYIYRCTSFSYRDLKHPTRRQNFYDTLEQKFRADLRPWLIQSWYGWNGPAIREGMEVQMFPKTLALVPPPLPPFTDGFRKKVFGTFLMISLLTNRFIYVTPGCVLKWTLKLKLI